MKTSLAEQVKFIRETMDYTQFETAQAVGTNQTMICLIERGYIPVTKPNVIKEISNLYAFLKNLCKDFKNNQEDYKA